MKPVFNACEKAVPSKTPLEQLEDFFEWYSVDNARQELWGWLKQVIVSESGEYNTPLKRNEQFFFYEKLVSLLDASYAQLYDHSSDDEPVRA